MMSMVEDVPRRARLAISRMLLLGGLLFAFGACGGEPLEIGKSSAAIANPVGTPGNTYSPPWMGGDTQYHPIVRVFAQDAEGRNKECSGTFITPFHVVTVAHCFPRLWTRPGENAGANQIRIGYGLPHGPVTARVRYGYQQDPSNGSWTWSTTAHKAEWLWLHPQYDLAVFQVATPYKGPTMPIRWDAPTPSLVPRWYYSAIFRFSGYGKWPQPGGGFVNDVRTHGKALWHQQVNPWNGPAFQLTPDPSGGCSGDSGGPVYVLRRARHKDGTSVGPTRWGWRRSSAS